jgi:TrmH family RNA methyltransferase
MKNFDQNDLWIVNPQTPIDDVAKAYAMHGSDVLLSSRIVNTLDEALSGMDITVATSSVVAKSPTNVTRIPITPKELALKLTTSKGHAAIVFGRESSGLSNLEIEHCDLIVTIPASHEYNVLNLSTAASIILYEIFQVKQRNRVRTLATNTTRQQLLLQYERLVNRSGTLPHKKRLATRAFRNVISRSFILKREASLLIGVFRKAASKLV